MTKKGGNFFEQHIEKIVLAVGGAVCVWILVTRVLLSPNYVKYGNDSLGPGEIDPYISRQAELLERRLQGEAEPRESYESRLGDFVALVQSSISNIDASVFPPQPHYLGEESIQAAYNLPVIGEVNDVAVGHIRAAAYVPTEEIGEYVSYEAAACEPNDIDLVTVEAKFDVAGLCEKFYECFAGEYVEEEWRDPCLAKPIFAAIQLQRQELGPDGLWSDWQDVPRTRIDSRKEIFEVIEEVEDLPVGGMEVRLLQFDDPYVRMDLLQPEPYSIASAEEEWFPPSLHKKFVEYQKDEEARRKREAREAEKKEREQERQQELAERGSRGLVMGERSPKGVGGRLRGGQDLTRRGGSSLRNPNRRIDSRRDRERLSAGFGRSERTAKAKEGTKTKSVNDFYDEYDKITITEKTNLAELREPLVFWAHDDTVEPGKSYQYRIRLGVFNPIAGTDQFGERDQVLKDKVVLWSEFAEAQQTVDIPAKLYFFPLSIQEAAKIVTVKVSKYVLGYWYGQKFKVRQGEVVGKIVENEQEQEKEKEAATVPEKIDYTTGAVFVDSVCVNDWSGTNKLRARLYYDMLYSFDGTNIEHLPIKLSYWPTELQSEFSTIQELEKQERKPFRGWSRGAGRRGGAPRVRLGGEESYDYEGKEGRMEMME